MAKAVMAKAAMAKAVTGKLVMGPLMAVLGSGAWIFARYAPVFAEEV